MSVIHLKDTDDTLFDRATVIDAPDADDEETTTGADIAVAMATAGYFKTADDVPSNFAVDGCNTQQAQQLDCYPPSYTWATTEISTWYLSLHVLS